MAGLLGDIFDVGVESTGLSIFALAHGIDHSVTWPVNPDRMQVQTGAKLVMIDTLRDGEHPFPRGRKAERVRLTGTLPGLGRFDRGQQTPGWVSLWAFPPPNFGPRVFLKRLIDLQEMGEEGRSRFIVTRPYVNMLCYVEAVEWGTEGAFGDITYAIDLIEARDVGPPASDPDPTMGFPQKGTPIWDLIVNNPLNPFRPGGSGSTQHGQAVPGQAVATGIPAVTERQSVGIIGGLKRRPGGRVLFPGVYEALGGESWQDVSFFMYSTTANAEGLRQLNYAYSTHPFMESGWKILAPLPENLTVYPGRNDRTITTNPHGPTIVMAPSIPLPRTF